MNTVLHESINLMHDSKERVRAMPVCELPEEEYGYFEKLCSDLMRFGSYTGLRMNICSVTDLQYMTQPTPAIAVALVDLQLSLNKLVAAYGFAELFDEACLKRLDYLRAHPAEKDDA